jgi:metal-responsive CopG/Arc/MetJ family transcriptional regulator
MNQMPRAKPSATKKVAASVRDWQPVSIKLPRELVQQIEAIAAGEERTRTKVIEFACREYVQNHQRRSAAA